MFDGQLLTGILPLAGDLSDRLTEGIRTADIGCGTGHALNLMARAYPASRFVGYDLSVETIERAQQEVRDYAVSNVAFEVLDVSQLPADPPFRHLAFDAMHDQVDPARRGWRGPGHRVGSRTRSVDAHRRRPCLPSTPATTRIAGFTAHSATATQPAEGCKRNDRLF